MDYSRDSYGLQPRIFRGTAPIDGDAMPNSIVPPRPANTLRLHQRPAGGQCTTSLLLSDCLHPTLQILGYGWLDRLDSTASRRRRSGGDALEARP